MLKYKYSIITISFNSCRTIERTLKSVLSQTYADFEYIIIDGSSKDSTVDIIKKYESLFNGRMKWVSEPDKGIYDAMNKGIKMAQGEIIGIVNSDDWLEPNALQIVNDAFNKNKNSKDSLYIGWMNFHYDENNSQVLKTSHDKLMKKAKVYQMAGINHPATFVPKSIYEKIGIFDDRMKISADADFILRCYFANLNFYYINKVITNMDGNGVSNTGGWKITKKSYADRKIILRKYVTNPFMYTFFQAVWLMKVLGKQCIPSSFLKLIRKY